MSLLRSLAPIGLCCGLLGCAAPETNTDGPDMSALQEAYGEPTGELSRETALGFFTDLNAKRRSLARFGGMRLIPELLESAQAELNDRGKPKEAEATSFEVLGHELSAEGTLEVTHQCMANRKSSEQVTRGELNLRIGVDEAGFRSTGHVQFERCLTHSQKLFDELEMNEVPGKPVLLEGVMDVHLGEGEGFEDLKRRPYLMDYRGPLTYGGHHDDHIELDFIVELQLKRIELRATNAEGRHVLFRFQKGKKEGRLRARNGVFVCHAERKRCRSERGDRIIDW